METETTFGVWLRQQRRERDWTQAELAQRVGYSLATIRKLERDELRPSKHLAQQLACGLDVAVTYHASLVSFARSTPTIGLEPDIESIHQHRRSNLPSQLTPFFGRTDEIAELIQHLANPTGRLITIVGPGGIGKTRLALEVAQAVLEASSQTDSSDDPKLVLEGSQIQNPNYEEGVYFVALAPLRTHEHIVPAIAEAIHFRFQANNRLPKQQLFDYLRHKQMLLVLDNFEHLQAGSELIFELLQECPELHLLVTARERLHLHSEMLFVLDSLATPTAATLPDVLSYSTVQLFIETACRLRPKFTLTPTNAQAVVRICQLVNGIPLALILAAAWVEVLSPDEIVAELSQGFDFLEAELRDLPERQRSMRAVLTQSWQRLTDAERAVFMRLAVFRGGFTRLAAQSVANASLHIISNFVNKSLLQCDPSGRYTIHELLRQFAEAELATAKQTVDAYTAHSIYYTDFLQQREADLKGQRQMAALDEIETDFENIRAALHYAIERKYYSAVGHALEALYWFCDMRSRHQEELELLRFARSALAPVADEEPHPIWGRVMSYVLGTGIMFFEPPTESALQLETALALAQKNNRSAEIAFCLWHMALNTWQRNDLNHTVSYFEQSIAYYRSLGDGFYLAYLLKEFGVFYFTLAQPDKSAPLIKQSLDLRRQSGDLIGLADSVGAMGWIAYNLGCYHDAEAHWQESSQLLRNLRAPHMLGVHQYQLAWLALFNRGDLASVRSLATDIGTVALNLNEPQSIFRMLILFGILAGLNEEYDAGHQFFQQIEALNYSYFPFTASWRLIGLCLIACGLNDLSTIQQNLQQLLEISIIQQWPATTAKGLAFAAILAARTGDAERATELLSLVFHHPLSPKGWLEQWPLITRLRHELEVTLTQERFQTVWEHGKTLDLLEMAKAELAD